MQAKPVHNEHEHTRKNSDGALVRKRSKKKRMVVVTTTEKDAGKGIKLNMY